MLLVPRLAITANQKPKQKGQLTNFRINFLNLLSVSSDLSYKKSGIYFEGLSFIKLVYFSLKSSMTPNSWE
jgi:hypothetical protein